MPIINFSFENPVLGSGGYQYGPAGATWSFNGNAGMAANGSPWYPPAAPHGTQAGFIQFSNSSISQAITFPSAGIYTVSFSVVGRGGYGSLPLSVTVDGTTCLSLTAAQISETAWTNYTSNTFTVTAGAHTLAFVNGVLSGDHANDIDHVQINVINADPTLPVTSGLALWVDASQLNGAANGQQINTWTDLSGLANHALRQSGSSAGYPQYVQSALNGKPVLRFNSTTSSAGDYFKFNRIANIRSVFWVLKENADLPDGRFLLGDDSSYDFHRATANGALWQSNYSSANIRGGTTRLMGTASNGTTTALPSGSFQCISLVTSGNVQANQICQDRTYHGSWQGDIAEIIIYTTALSANDEALVNNYLMTKYALGAPVNTAPTVATAAKATPSPVTGTTTVLSVLGADDAGEANLTYTWATMGTPPAAVAFSANGTNAAKSSTASFTASGSYTFQCTIKDAGNLTVISNVTLTVTLPSTLPVTSGLALWVDASQLGGVTNDQQVNTWTDMSVLANHAIRQSGSSSGYPKYVQNVLNGKPVVRFNSATSSAGDYFKFNRIANIRSVFWVLKENAGLNDGHFLLGDDTFYDFHRAGANGQIWHSTYANSSIRGGTTRLMGTAVNGTTTTLPAAQFQILSLVTTGNVQANQICQDRTYHGSWQGDIAEIIIYSTALSASDEALVNNYLASKYGLALANAAPTVAMAATATPNPVTGTTTTLSALGADGGGEANLTYFWATTGTPPATVTFSANGTNAAKICSATFTQAGNYSFLCTIRDSGNLSVTSSVTVTVAQTATAVAVTPASTWVALSGTANFTATLKDQFGFAMATQPTWAWTTNADTGGSISATGVFTGSATAGGPHTVTATGGGFNATANIGVSSAPTFTTVATASPNPVTGTTVSLAATASTTAGGSIIYVWSLVGTPPATVNLSTVPVVDSGANAAVFSAIGSYQFQVTATDARGASASSTVTVNVTATATSVLVTPATMTAKPATTRTFTASVRDQFGAALVSQPAITWTTTGGGSIASTTGVLTAAATAGGPYTVTATGGGKSGTASLMVGSVAPIAQSQSLESLSATATAVVLGASDANGDTLTWRVVTTPTHGTLTGTEPNLNYSSAAGYVGADSFTFVANDGTSDSNTATVSLVVVPTAVASVDATQSPLVMPAAFDAVRWANDANYKAWYLANPEPGRIWQTADPGASIPILTATVALRQATTAYGTVTLSVTTLPNQPVTFLSFGNTSLGSLGAQVVTVQANAAGLATVTANAGRAGSSTVQASSPATSGTVRFVVVAP